MHVAVSPLLLALSCLYHLSIPSHEHLDALLRPPRCAQQAKADLRSGSGEASQGGTKQTAARKRLAIGPQPSPQSGATGDSTGSPSPALNSSLSGTQLPYSVWLWPVLVSGGCAALWRKGRARGAPPAVRAPPPRSPGPSARAAALHLKRMQNLRLFFKIHAILTTNAPTPSFHTTRERQHSQRDRR